MVIEAMAAAANRLEHVKALEMLERALLDAEFEADRASSTAPDERKRGYLRGLSNRIHEMKMNLAWERGER